MKGDLEYYRRRLREEREQAALADRPDVRSVHEKLAAMYEDRITFMSRGPKPLRPVPDSPSILCAAVPGTG